MNNLACSLHNIAGKLCLLTWERHWTLQVKWLR